MKTLAIIGAGHLGQQIAHYAIADNHYQHVVFFDDISTQTEVCGFPVLGTCEKIEKEFQKRSFDELIIGIGYKHLEVRKLLYEKHCKYIPFGKIIHSSCWVDSTAIIQQGCVIYPSCTIDANAMIAENTVLNLACTIAHDTTIGKHCFVSPRAAIAGYVKVDEMCVVGINATLIDNISISTGTQIGAGTVVIKTIQEPGLYVGNPHRFVR